MIGDEELSACGHNIPFLSKLLKEHIFNCINEHMKEHNLGEDLQSAYRPVNSTETALLHVKGHRIQHDQLPEKTRCIPGITWPLCLVRRHDADDGAIAS